MGKNVVLLSGGSKKLNEPWVKKVKLVLEDFFDNVFFQRYDNWVSGELFPDYDGELKKLEENCKQFDDYVILAKSFGTLLTLNNIYDKVIAPEKCIFLGVPVDLARNKNGINRPAVDDWFVNYSVPSLFVQQENDSEFAYEKLEKLLKEKNVSNYELMMVSGSDHMYDDIDFRKIIKNFFEK